MTEPETNPVTSEETHVTSKGGRHDAAGQHPAIPPLRRGDMASSTADKQLADGLISLGMEPGQAVAYAAEHSAGVNATSLGERLYRALYNEGATPLSSYSPAIQRGFERGARAFLKSLTRANPHLIAAAPDGYAAAKDALAGWRYIREHHGDLYGVGWDRVENALAAFIAKAEGRA